MKKLGKPIRLLGWPCTPKTRYRQCRVLTTENIPISGDKDNISEVSRQYRKVMRKVPQPVVVVTAAIQSNGEWTKRGVTCGSFTSSSLQPPVVSFNLNNPSRMHTIIQETQYFAVNILSKDQVKYSYHFSTPAKDGLDQFHLVPHIQGIQGIPLIQGSSASIQCKVCAIHSIGDHHVCYGEVIQAEASQDDVDPLLYYARSYRSVGDETFMQAFENKTLLFEDWTHEAHLRMAWNYIQEYGKEKAIPLIKKGIKEYNEQNKHLVQRGYHETITMFFIHLVDHAIHTHPTPDIQFEEFLEQNQHLTDSNMLFNYYSKEVVQSKEAFTQFITPDRKPLPR